MPELRNPAQEEQQTKAVLAHGADAIKIFTGSFLGVNRVALMPLPIIKAVTTEVPRQGKLVVAHPRSLQGVELTLVRFVPDRLSMKERIRREEQSSATRTCGRICAHLMHEMSQVISSSWSSQVIISEAVVIQ